MREDNLFSIGDMARMFHLSVSSLRHYDEMGLVRPEYTNPETGYRYYSVRQFEPLNTICYLRVLDMPLAEIADFLSNRDTGRMEEKLVRQKRAVAEKRRTLARIERKIDNRLATLRGAQRSVLGLIREEMLPSYRMVFVASPLCLHSAFDMEAPIRRLEAAETETAVFLGKVGVAISKEHLEVGAFGQYDGIFLLLDKEDTYKGKVLCLPAVYGVSVRFRGSHAEAPAVYTQLLSYMQEKGYVPDGFSREITLIDGGLTNDSEKFVTEIMIPIASRKE